jgi:MFS family permease
MSPGKMHLVYNGKYKCHRIKCCTHTPYRFRFREPRFLAVVAATVLSTFSLFIPPYFIPLFARSMGYSQQIAIVTLAAWNLASTVGRIGAGIAADRLLGPLNSLLVCLLFMGLSSLVVWPLSQTTGVFAVYLVFNGLGCGAFFSLVPSTLGQLFGGKNTMGIVPIVWTTWFCGFFFVSLPTFITCDDTI